MYFSGGPLLAWEWQTGRLKASFERIIDYDWIIYAKENVGLDPDLTLLDKTNKKWTPIQYLKRT